MKAEEKIYECIQKYKEQGITPKTIRANKNIFEELKCSTKVMFPEINHKKQEEIEGKIFSVDLVLDETMNFDILVE